MQEIISRTSKILTVLSVLLCVVIGARCIMHHDWISLIGTVVLGAVEVVRCQRELMLSSTIKNMKDWR